MAASRAAHLPHILRASRQVTAAARHNAACQRVFCALLTLCTDEDSPPLANELWCSVERTLVASDEIQVNVMQKSVVYWKWPNVVDI